MQSFDTNDSESLEQGFRHAHMSTGVEGVEGYFLREINNK